MDKVLEQLIRQLQMILLRDHILFAKFTLKWELLLVEKCCSLIWLDLKEQLTVKVIIDKED